VQATVPDEKGLGERAKFNADVSLTSGADTGEETREKKAGGELFQKLDTLGKARRSKTYQ